MTFRTVEDHHYKEAGEAIARSRVSGPAEGNGYDEPSSAHLIAAGAALALGRAMPRLIAQSYDTGPNRYFEEGTRPWRHLHGAVARFIETDINEPNAIASRGAGVGMVVSDVLQRVSASKIAMAIGSKDFETGLNEAQLELVIRARSDKSLNDDISNIARGSFDRLSPDMAASLKEALDEPLPGKLGSEVELIARAVDGLVDRREDILSAIESGEDYLPLGNFSQISDRSFEYVRNYHESGISTGEKYFDDAFELLAAQGHIRESAPHDDPIFIAQARLIQEGYDNVSMAPSDLASMAISDAEIMHSARRGFMATDIETGSAPFDLSIKGTGEYHELNNDEGSPSPAESIERQIILSQKARAVDMIKLEVAMLEKSGVAALAKETELQAAVQTEPESLAPTSPAANSNLMNQLAASVSQGHSI